MRFLWERDMDRPDFPPLEGEQKTDVLVIGGGMAGVLCARLLTDAGVDCVLLEGREIGRGVTRGTTAVLSAQHSTLYTDLIHTFGTVAAKGYLDANLQALARLREMARRFPCELEDAPSILYDLTDGERMRREAAMVRALGFEAEFTTELPIPLKVAGAVRFPGMAQFHPLRFLYGAARGLRIYEHSLVTHLDGMTAHTGSGSVSAHKIILATHFPLTGLHGLFFMKLYQKRSFVIAVEGAPKLSATLEDFAPDGLYFRSYGELMIVGGGDKRTGRRSDGFEAPRAFIRSAWPKAREVYAWSNQDCITLDGVPYIGPYSASEPDIFVATGFNEWGMTTSMVAAELLSDRILGHENRFAPIFSPQRSMLHPQLFANLGSTLLDFCIPTTRRCPHMGCALRWDDAEHAWACPCHGSCFSETGQVRFGPAKRDANVK